MNKGKLYIVATPIGNLDDISFRALSVLSQVNMVAAEDTRHSKKLLFHYQIKTPVVSLHAHNEEARANQLINHLKQGKDIAYITDAGTPAISDPGSYFVNLAQKEAIQVIPIPGPCAAIAALSVSGMFSEHFLFEGFLPAKASQRRRRLQELNEFPYTLVFYEAPHRILKALEEMLSVFGPLHRIVIARELTKQFETIYTGTLSEVYEWLSAHPEEHKGEFVILLAGNRVREEKELLLSIQVDKLLKLLLEELPLKKAVSLVSRLTGEKKNSLYQQALKLKR